jgi:hypothetical protein
LMHCTLAPSDDDADEVISGGGREAMPLRSESEAITIIGTARSPMD